MSPLDKLIHELAKLPGIGQKTALRLVLYILRQPSEYARALAEALLDVEKKIQFCTQCFHLTDKSLCTVCSDTKRDNSLICIVEESSDLLALERTNGYRGVYHVLQGALSPIDGIGPDDLRIEELVHRCKKETIKEVILATNPNVVGDATALYVAHILKPLGIRITKLAAGIPVGGDIEYVDQITLSKALELRVEY